MKLDELLEENSDAPVPDGWKVKYDLWHPHQLVEDDHVPKGWKTGPGDALVPDGWKENDAPVPDGWKVKYDLSNILINW